MALDEFLLEAEDKMIKTEQVVVNEFAGVRTGKASSGLVENIIVEVYGSQMRIRELAGITTPEPRTLAIQPWDMNSLHPIEKAIQKAISASRPPSRERSSAFSFPNKPGTTPGIRQNRPENGRRRPRRHPPCPAGCHGTTEEARPRQRDHGGRAKHAEKELQKLTDDYIAKIDAHLATKEKEIMTV